jgi:hypothetical protein
LQGYRTLPFSCDYAGMTTSTNSILKRKILTVSDTPDSFYSPARRSAIF